MTATLPAAATTSDRTETGNYFVSNYPPFSTWSPAAIPRLEEALDTPARGRALALYVHVPFCRQRCAYCYFRVHAAKSGKTVDRYIDLLLEELALYLERPALRGRRLRSVYFGGGSPSYLTAAQIERLLTGLDTALSWREVIETTFEIDPGTASPDKLAALGRLGVTRVSLGFQSLDDEVLRRNGRLARREDCLRAHDEARRAGFDEINVDLVAGLPGETDLTWRRTIEDVVALRPDCVTIYQLEVAWNSSIHAIRERGGVVDVPSWSCKRRWTEQAFTALERAGYTVASGYMAVRDPARWRFVYTVEHFWHGGDVLALGESAFGHFDGVHYQNLDALGDYASVVDQRRLPWNRARKLNGEEALRREVILQLKTGSLDLAYFELKYSVDLRRELRREIALLSRDRLIEETDGALRLTREGLLMVDALLPAFYLPEHRNIRYT